MEFNKLKVLIVDDCFESVEKTKSLIEESKFNIESIKTCQSVESFNDLISNSSFDLFLFDCSLPDGTGIGMIENVKKTNPESISIILTGKESEEVARKALNLGAQDYILKKEMSLRNLERAISHSIERHKLIHRLVQSEKALNSTNDKLNGLLKAKTKFLSYFSHEVRTPLAIISGTTELLASTHLNQQQQECIQSFQRANSHLMELINDVLDTSKVESGGYKLSKSDFYLSSLVDDILSIAKPACDQKGLQFRIKSDVERSMVINSDMRAIRHVLLNLVNNAIKFCKKGSIELRISQDSENPFKLSFDVKDTGPGIQEKDLSNIFKVFGTNGTTRYGDARSSGIGLNLARQIVALLGGEISASSENGKGSVFSFYVTTNEVSLSQVNKKLGSANKLSGLVKKTPFKILMVEDDSECINLVKAYFKNSHLKIDYAVDGFEAICLIQSNNYDLILTDLNMPVLSGEMVLRKARSWQIKSKLSKTPIYALSGNVFKSDVNRVSKIGFDGFIPKPFNKKCLDDVIENFESFLEKGEFYSTLGGVN